MKKLIVNEELKTLLPPLSAEEFAGLERNILECGCLSPLVIWNNIIIDGHHRYEICSKYGVSFDCNEVQFTDIGEAKVWAWRHQEHRRNLTPFQRAELALKFKDDIAKRAKERQGLSDGRGRGKVTGPPISTLDEVGKIAGVSRTTIRMVESILQHADEKTKERLRGGEKGVTINSEYCRLKAETDGAQMKMEFRHPRKEHQTILIHQDIIPEELADFLITNFSLGFLQYFVRVFFGKLLERHRNDSAR